MTVLSKPSNSWIWKGIIAARNRIWNNLIWHVDDGKDIDCWLEPWIPNIPFGRPSGPPPHLRPISKVSELICHSQRCWMASLIRTIFQQDIAEAILSIPFSAFPSKNTLRWHPEINGLLTAKSVYRSSQTKPSPSNFKWANIWRLNIHFRVQFFVWKALQDGIPTNHKLRFVDYSRVASCSRCLEEVETTTRALFFWHASSRAADAKEAEAISVIRGTVMSRPTKKKGFFQQYPQFRLDFIMKCQLKNQWDYLKKQWQVWRGLINQTGHGYDPVVGTFDWPEEVWEKIIAVNSEANRFKTALLQHRDLLEKLFEGLSTTEDFAWSSGMASVPSSTQQSEYAPLSDDMNVDDTQVPLAGVDYPWEGEAIPSYDAPISPVREYTPGSTSRSRTPAVGVQTQSNRKRSAAAFQPFQPLEPTELVQSLIAAITDQGTSSTSVSKDNTTSEVLKVLQDMVSSSEIDNELFFKSLTFFGGDNA
ncbi:hypothetical protein GIB67_022188 [Kingdonia uniflora]|uniref:Reverse transcriptase zinc-binding domain-containing protein n=1 Tax=Kingdonia uniflora TaxID=39325 RepID=A0A7J7MVW5_9MAGN|nr:hypothetical protein GIB67_022188 [Kingdonia uniflora]